MPNRKIRPKSTIAGYFTIHFFTIAKLDFAAVVTRGNPTSLRVRFSWGGVSRKQ